MPSCRLDGVERVTGSACKTSISPRGRFSFQGIPVWDVHIVKDAVSFSDVYILTVPQCSTRHALNRVVSWRNYCADVADVPPLATYQTLRG